MKHVTITITAIFIYYFIMKSYTEYTQKTHNTEKIHIKQSRHACSRI